MTVASTVRRKAEAAASTSSESGSCDACSSQAAEGTKLSGQYQASPAFSLSPRLQTKLEVGRAQDRYEREADSVADHVAAGRAAPAISTIPTGGLSAQRQCDCEATVQRSPEPAGSRPPVPSVAPAPPRAAPPPARPARPRVEPPAPAATPAATEAAPEAGSAAELAGSPEPAVDTPDGAEANPRPPEVPNVTEAGGEPGGDRDEIDEAETEPAASPETDEAGAPPETGTDTAPTRPDFDLGCGGGGGEEAATEGKTKGDGSCAGGGEPMAEEPETPPAEGSGGGEAPAPAPAPAARDPDDPQGATPPGEEHAAACGTAQRKASDDAHESPAPREKQVEPKRGLDLAAASRHIQARGSGEPLPRAARQRIEASVGVDLAAVRVHQDGNAAQANKALRSRAFAHKNHIFLATGQSKHDVALMAHETTHVLQQGAIERRAPAEARAGRVEPRLPEPRSSEFAKPPAPAASASRGEHAPAAKKAAAALPAPGLKPAPAKAAPVPTSTHAEMADATKPLVSDEDRLHEVLDRLRAAARRENHHPPALVKEQQAAAAVRPPATEPARRAQDAHLDAMAKVRPGAAPNTSSFRETLQKRLEAMVPDDMAGMVAFKGSGAASTLRQDVLAQVVAQKTAAADPLALAVREAPAASSFPNPAVTGGLPAPAAEPKPRSLQAEQAVPQRRDVSSIFARGKLEAEALMLKHGIDEEKIRRLRLPQFEPVLKAKTTLDEHAREAPERYREQEDALLGKERQSAGRSGAQALAGMRATRTRALGKVLGAQVDRRDNEELEREQIAAQVRERYGPAERAVSSRLARLDGEVMTKFDRAEESVRGAFEDHVDERMQAYKDKRYDGLRGKARWLKDKFFSLPDDVNAFYVEGTALYVKHMSRALDMIARHVEGELEAARKDIAEAKAKVDEFVAGLDESKRRLADTALAEIEGEFERLEASIEDKQLQLANDLSQRYRDSRSKLDERIEELKRENRGYFEVFVDLFWDVIHFFQQLYEIGTTLAQIGGNILTGLLTDPGGFFGNLARAVGNGFSQFVGRFTTHLGDALFTFVTGTTRKAGLTGGPGGVLGLILEVVGLGAGQLEEKLTRLVGARNVERLRAARDVLSELLAHGASALLERIKEHVPDLIGRVMGSIKSWLITEVVEAGLRWLLRLLFPTAALLKTLWNFVKFLVNNVGRILQLVRGVLSAIDDVIAGKVATAADRVETSLARGLQVLLGFLANMLEIGNIGDKIRSIIARVRAPVTRAVDAILSAVVRGLKWVGGRVRGAASSTKQHAKTAVHAERNFLFPKRRFGAGKESHQLFFEGHDERARLMIRSDKQELQKFVKELSARPEHAKGPSRAALTEVQKQMKAIAAAEQRIAKDPVGAQKQISAALDVIAVQLELVLAGGQLATEENPLPIEYPKRASVHYPTLYIGPKVGSDGPRIRQTEKSRGSGPSLEAAARGNADRKALIASMSSGARHDFEASGSKIREFRPHERQALPFDGPTIGLTSEWQVQVGKKIELPASVGGTPGGGRINRALAPYGYSAALEEKDGDHVIEMQLGGQDILENLWTLGASENRSSGSLLASMKFRTPKGEMALSDLRKRAKQSRVWLVITRTKPV